MSMCQMRSNEELLCQSRKKMILSKVQIKDTIWGLKIASPSPVVHIPARKHPKSLQSVSICSRILLVQEITPKKASKWLVKHVHLSILLCLKQFSSIRGNQYYVDRKILCIIVNCFVTLFLLNHLSFSIYCIITICFDQIYLLLFIWCLLLL